MRQRIYETGTTKDGKRVVQSGTIGEWFLYSVILGFFKLIWFLCKVAFFCFFFWIIIPYKFIKYLINKKKNK